MTQTTTSQQPWTSTTASFLTPEIQFGGVTMPELLHKRAAETDFGFTFGFWNRDDERMSFRELGAHAGAVAAMLRSDGVRHGDRVALLGSTSPELLIALWAVWCAGAVPVVLSPPRGRADAATYPMELQRRLAQADAWGLIVSDLYASMLMGQLGEGRVLLTSELPTKAEADFDPAVCTESDIALLQFTSGTTALSRAVALTHRQVLSNVSSFSDAMGLSNEDRGVSWLPLYHDMGMLMQILSVVGPGDLMLLAPEDFARRPGLWLDAISRFRATLTVGPNMGYALATTDLRLRPRELNLSCLRVAGNGAEPIDAAVLAAFAAQAEPYGFAASTFSPMYGLAEATLAVTLTPAEQHPTELWVMRESMDPDSTAVVVEPETPGARHLLACGYPAPGVEVELRDSAGAVALSDRQVGEIWVRSPAVMSGYWRDAAASKQALVDGWLRTGDLGFRYENQLVVCGRIKDMIVVGGQNLYPEDYEQLAAAQPGVRGSNVVAFGLLESERMVVVAETPHWGEPAQKVARELMMMFTAQLSYAPQEVVLVAPGTLPKTSSGKLQRRTCRELYASGTLATIASTGSRLTARKASGANGA